MELENRLARCFASVFADLTTEQIAQASVRTVPTWDSLAAVTLLAVVEQEFGIEINPLDLADLNSYGAMKDYLRHRFNGKVSERSDA
jgi:acyl carrier protein